MNLKTSLLDNIVVFENGSITCLEIENHMVFYHFVKLLFQLQNGEQLEELQVYKDNQEVNLNNKVQIFVDFFNFEMNSKKNISNFYKYIQQQILEEDKDDLNKNYQKMIKSLIKSLDNIDIDFEFDINQEFDISSLLKILKLEIKEKESLLENLLLYIDIAKLFNKDDLLVFVNLKQYLSKEELLEFYKYAIYNNIKILMIDSQSYGVTLKYEKKLIVSSNMDELIV